MKDLKDYILEELTKEERGNNVLIDETDDYYLYCGHHLFERLTRHSDETGNISDKISLKSVKNVVKLGFPKIDDLAGIKLKINDPNSAICLVDKRLNLNVVVFIRKLERTGKYDLIIKTVMTKENYLSDIKRIVRETIEIDYEGII